MPCLTRPALLLQGCLGHGEADLYRGQLLPTRVGGALDIPQGTAEERRTVCACAVEQTLPLCSSAGPPLL